MTDERAGRVLVVDDEDNITYLLDSALRHFGFDVRVAETGRAGLHEVEQFNPDVVLLDVMLPDLDGFAVAERLTADGGGPVVVLCSSRDAAEFGDRIARSGARGFVPKADLSGAALEAAAG